MADAQITNPAVVAAPSTYQIAPGAEIELKCVHAEFDGSGAAGVYLPCVELLSTSGRVIARAVDQNVSVAAGASASVSWFPFLRRKRKPLPGDCVLLGSANGTATLTVTLTQAVPATGLLQLVAIGTTIQRPAIQTPTMTGVADSKGVAGWTTTSPAGQAQIGAVAQTVLNGGLHDTSLLISGVRPCTAGDLVAGDTVTGTWDTGGAPTVATAGLLIYMKAQNPAVNQDPGLNPEYAEGDSHPDFGASLTRMSWYTDFGVQFDHFWSPCHVITGMGAYPARSGFNPTNGAVIGEIASGSNSVAAACFTGPVRPLAVPDPGGTWPAGTQEMLLGNYQGATLLP